MVRALCSVISLLLVVSCTFTPKPDLKPAEHMVKRAYDMDAPVYAPSEYQAAYIALSSARRAMSLGDYDMANESVEVALSYARQASRLAQETKIKQIEEAKRAKQEEASREETVQETVVMVPKPPKVIKPPVAKPPPKVKKETKLLSEYNVGNGENLWTIAANPRVYNEGLLWPLLYQANRDQIKDPREIFPGQILNIRRDMTPEEKEEARQKARESDLFPMSANTQPKP